jgi:hypothetical protein
MEEAGHGVMGCEGLQVPVPEALCISPGFAWPQDVVGARTQPLDSCITMARMYSCGGVSGGYRRWVREVKYLGDAACV